MHALLTDRYQLSMLAAFRASGMHRRRAVFEAFVRRLPPCRCFLVVAGVERAVERVLGLRFGADDLAYLAEAGAAPGAKAWREAVRALERFRFTGSIHAMPDGTVAFPHEPLLRVEGPLEEAQLVETLILSILNHDTRVASKAARCVLAARGRPVIELGSRRTHELAAVDAARAACVAGCAGTSNEEAGKRFGLPVYGTMAHSYVLAHAEEGEAVAFARYCEANPDAAILLVDTYDTLRGVDRAIRAAGPRLRGIRLDSGDLLGLAERAREALDAAGLRGARIIASNDLNEYSIVELVRARAPIDDFGVGTEIVCSPDMPALGAVYKLVAIEGASGAEVPVAKRSSGKATYPGAKQVWRRLDGGDTAVFDEIGLADETRVGAPLLVEMVRGGERVRDPEGWEQARARGRVQLAELPQALKDIPDDPAAARREVYPVERTQPLQSLFQAAVQREV